MAGLPPDKPLFRPEVLQARAQRLDGTVCLAQPWSFQILTWLIALVVLIALVFLSLADYARKETARGVLEPAAGMIRVQAPQPGMVSALRVTEGERVEAGQLLLQLSGESYVTEVGPLNQALADETQAQLLRIEDQLVNERSRYEAQSAALEMELDELVQQQYGLGQQLALFAERLTINRELLEQVESLGDTGHVSRLEQKRQKDILLSMNQQYLELSARRQAVAAQRAQVEQRQSQLPLDHHDQHSRLEAQGAELRNQLLRLRQQQASELRSPVTGLVSGVLVHHGQHVNTGQSLLSIIPEDSSLQVVLYLSTGAIGMLSTNQPVNLRFDAFPYQRFGVHPGRVREIGATVIFPEELPVALAQPAYRVVVDLDTQQIEAYGRSFPLRPGMELEGDIITERRSLIRWLFDPIFSVQGRLQ